MQNSVFWPMNPKYRFPIPLQWRVSSAAGEEVGSCKALVAPPAVAELGKEAQVMEAKSPLAGVTRKVSSLSVYPVFVAVTVRTHSVSPEKEILRVLSSQEQSPEVWAVVWPSAAGTETEAPSAAVSAPTFGVDGGKESQTREVNSPEAISMVTVAVTGL